MGFVVWMIYIANTGGNSVFFDIVRTTRDGDKIGHFFLYGLLALGCNITLKFRTVGRFPFCIYWGSLAVGLFTLAEEFSQAFLPHRTLDARDLYADAAGILCFTLLTAIIHAGVYIVQQRQVRQY